MRVLQLALPGACVIEHELFADGRGRFFEGWNQRSFPSAGIGAHFVQENGSLSRRFVLRGLHYQIEHAQGKLLRVLAGRIFDVLVDLRRSSPCFGRSIQLELDPGPGRSLWVPAALAHGFLALADDTQVQYKVTDFWVPAAERTLAWDDPALGISWPLPAGTPPILSDKDRDGQKLGSAETFA